MKFKQEIFIFILLVFLIFSISVVSANQSLDDTSNDELVLLSNNNLESVHTLNTDSGTAFIDNSANLEDTDTNEIDESESRQNQKNILSASNNEELILTANDISIDTYVAQYGFTFIAIQKAINDARSGDNIFLNGHNFTQTGTAALTTNKNINIYGGRTVSDSIMAKLDAKNKNRSIAINGLYDIVLKNIHMINGIDSPEENVLYYSDNSPYWTSVSNAEHTPSLMRYYAHILAGSSILILNYGNKLEMTNILVENSKNSYGALGFAVGVFSTNFIVDNLTVINTTRTIPNGCGGVELIGNGVIRDSTVKNTVAISAVGMGMQTVTADISRPILIDHCQFINNSNTNKSANMHGGGLCMASDAICQNSLFVNNSNDQGGAITIHNDGSLVNCTFINNTATSLFGGGISTGLTNLELVVNIINCTFENNQAPYGGGAQLKGNGIYIFNSTFENNSAVKGGGCYLEGPNVIIENSTFNGNNVSKSLRSTIILNTTHKNEALAGAAAYIYGASATVNGSEFYNHNSAGSTVYIVGANAGIDYSIFENNTAINGAGVYIDGSNAKINNSNFNNNSAVDGAGVYITGRYAVVQDSSFDNNTAVDGAGVYIKGVKVSNVIRSDAQIMDNDFTGNNVSSEGGAVYIEGAYSTFAGNNFTENNAIPSLDSQGNPINDIDGLGGAIYIVGSNTVSANNTFTHNTARNGSAIYTDGSSFKLENDVFKENQAWSYLLITTAVPEESYYNENDTNVTVIHKGGDNVLNAIFNKAAYSTITFKNVTYSHSKLGNITSPDTNFYIPHDGATPETTLYQDSREHYQLINLTIINNDDNSVEYHNATLYTDIYGNVTLMFPKGYFKKGTYTVYAEHPEDWNYKYIANTATFAINYSLTDDKTVSNKTPYYGTEVDFNLTIHNDADAVYNDNGYEIKRIYEHDGGEYLCLMMIYV